MALRGAVELIAQAGGGVVEGYPHDLQEGEKMRPQFLDKTTRSLYEQTGFRASATTDPRARKTA
jgi:hypothetical protein